MVCAGESYLVGVPTVPFNVSAPEQKYSLKNLRAIVVDLRHLAAVDNDGLTLIPPTLWSFAETFRSDLADLGLNIPVLPGLVALDHTLFLTLSDQAHEFLDAAGRPTSEGYEIKVTTESITLAGASPLGAWWGTRTVLQQAVLNDLEIPVGQGIDAPGWSERGLMVSYQTHHRPNAHY
jgi:hexosaminidase